MFGGSNGGSVFDHRHYVPLLKGKAGEFGALAELSVATKAKITPLIEVPPVTDNLETGKPNKPLDIHLAYIADKIKAAWGDDRPLFVDLFWIELKDRTDKGVHPLACIFERFRSIGVLGIPSTGFDRDHDYNSTAKAIIATDQRGVCIRLLDEDMEDTGSLKDKLQDLQKSLGVARKSVHLLMDFRDVAAEDVERSAEVSIELINTLPGISDYRTLTLAASGFPGSLAKVESSTTAKLTRTELSLRKKVLSQGTGLQRIPTFGDYAIAHPDLLEADWRKFKLSGSIRYTLEKDWLIVKGGSIEKHEFKQFHKLANQLSNRTDFYGADFSWGDKYIAKCATKQVTSGNLTTWRKIGTNHHITVVGAQI
jgi:hypothetical protein